MSKYIYENLIPFRIKLEPIGPDNNITYLFKVTCQSMRETFEKYVASKHRSIYEFTREYDLNDHSNYIIQKIEYIGIVELLGDLRNESK